MKKCNSCGEQKDVSEFGKWSKSKDGLYYKCKSCRRQYDRDHYKGSENRRAIVRAVDTKNRLSNAIKLQQYKYEKGCTDCGIDNPVVLDFDHLRDKEHNVSDMVRHGRSWKSILAEIEKCEVVCSNCHRIRTHNRRMA